jgi:hypothetical protein
MQLKTILADQNKWKTEFQVSKTKIDIQKKTRRIIRQKTQQLLKEYGRTLQLHQNSKPANMSIEGGEEVQAKGIHNIFNKITAKNFPNLKKEMPIQV